MSTDLIMEIEDKSGDKATTSVKLPTGSSVANMTTFAVAWATAMNDFILGKILSVIAYALAPLVTIINNTILETADVEHIGKFQFITVNGNRVQFNVPALNEAIVLAYTSDELNQADPEVAAVIAAMTTGIAVTGGTISPCDIGEGNISDIIFAREAFKNSGARR